MGIELNHNGHFSLPEYCGGQQPMSASAMKMPNGNLVREMTEDDMEQVAEAYAKSALMARRGGFEQVLLHYGHGWLMGGWMSPLVNHRTDKYGGSIENRARFPRMVLERIRKEVGDSIHLELRISGSELVPGGLEIGEVTEFIKIYQDLVDLVHISCGTRMAAHTRADMHPSQFLPHAHNAAMSKYVKEHGVTIPVGVVGNISDPVQSERLLAEGYADYVVMVRSTIADPGVGQKGPGGARGRHPPLPAAQPLPGPPGGTGRPCHPACCRTSRPPTSACAPSTPWSGTTSINCGSPCPGAPSAWSSWAAGPPG